MNRVKDHLGKVVLAICLAYAPWHDSWTLGQRPFLNIPGMGIASLTSGGLANFFLISIVGVFIWSRLIPDMVKKGLDRHDFLPLAYFAWSLLTIRKMDFPTFTILVNTFFFSSLVLAVLRKDIFTAERVFLFRYGLSILGGSYLLAILLPYLVPISGYEIFLNFGLINRYRGWLGEGQPIGFLGFVICFWAGILILIYREVNWKLLFWILLGFVGMDLNVLRLAMFSTAVFFLVGAIAVGIKRESSKVFIVFLWVGCAAVFFIFTGSFAAKNKSGGWVENLPRAVWIEKKASLSNAVSLTPSKDHLISLDPSGMPKVHLEKLDNVIVSNKRGEIYLYLLHQLEGSYIFGMGPGSCKRFLRSSPFQISDVGGDFFRIFFEFGLIGLVLLIATLVTVIMKAFSHRAAFFAVLGGFSSILLTDAFLIIPAFGYGPAMICILASRAMVEPSLEEKAKMGHSVNGRIPLVLALISLIFGYYRFTEYQVIQSFDNKTAFNFRVERVIMDQKSGLERRVLPHGGREIIKNKNSQIVFVDHSLGGLKENFCLKYLIYKMNDTKELFKEISCKDMPPQDIVIN